MEALTQAAQTASVHCPARRSAQDQVIERHKAPVALATILAIVGLAAFGVVPYQQCSPWPGRLVLVLAKILTPRDAYRAIDWPVLILIAGMIALGNAMGKTGALDVAADRLLGQQRRPTGSLTRPSGFSTSSPPASASSSSTSQPRCCAPRSASCSPPSLGVEAKPFIMAVAFAASTAMATPMGYQTNLLVYGPGGYNYRDFVSFGLPLNVLIGVIACWLIPRIWPF